MSTEQQQELSEAEVEEIRQGRLLEWGKALGLNEDFTRDVVLSGMGAIIDRAEAADETGALGRGLLLVQHLGIWLEERTLESGGEGGPQPGEYLEAVGVLSEQFDIPRELGMKLAGAVLDTYHHTLRQLAKKAVGRGTNANDRARP